jgi:hypothetical protein
MRKLLILTAALMLTSSAAGCRCCDWLWRGALWNPCVPAYSDPYPAYTPCDPCLTSPTTVVPGPGSYAEPALP